MAEVEYQVDEMLFKMNALSGTSGLPEKPPLYPTDSDTYNTDRSSGDSEVSSTPSRRTRYPRHPTNQAQTTRMTVIKCVSRQILEHNHLE